MKRVIRFALLALVVVAVMAPAYAVTVGDFLTQIAQVKNLPAKDATTAASSLKSAGVKLPTLDLSATLNEGTVAQIAGSLGLNVTTSNPSAPFSQGQVDSFVTSFSSELGGRTSGGTNSPMNENKGLKKGHTKSHNAPV